MVSSHIPSVCVVIGASLVYVLITVQSQRPPLFCAVMSFRAQKHCKYMSPANHGAGKLQILWLHFVFNTVYGPHTHTHKHPLKPMCQRKSTRGLQLNPMQSHPEECSWFKSFGKKHLCLCKSVSNLGFMTQ